MLGITIICVDKLREAYLREAAAEYEKRMSSYCRLKTIEVTGDSEIAVSYTHLARDIVKKIEAELEYPGQIKINVIR